MTDDLITVSELDETARTTALTGFANFYITLWQNNNLELLSEYDRQEGFIQNINRELAANRFFTPEEELSASVAFNQTDYAHLIDEIDMHFHLTGNPETNWATWYDNQFASLAKS